MLSTVVAFQERVARQPCSKGSRALSKELLQQYDVFFGKRLTAKINKIKTRIKVEAELNLPWLLEEPFRIVRCFNRNGESH